LQKQVFSKDFNNKDLFQSDTARRMRLWPVGV